jgi:fibronectin-binding autotransporter adhesin
MKAPTSKLSKSSKILATSIASLVALAGPAFGQAILLTGPTTYTQNFNTLGTANVAWSDGVTVDGWHAGMNSNTTADGTLQATDGGAAGANSALSGLLNLGVTGDADRALGSKTTGTGGFANISYGVLFRNTSSNYLRISNLGYAGEIWHTNSGATTRETWTTSYKVSDTLFTDTEPGGSAAAAAPGTFTALAGLNWTAPNLNVANGSVNGNLAANRVALTLNNPNGGILLAPGAFFMFRWVDTNLANNDGYQAIDDFSATFDAARQVTWDLNHTAGGAPNGNWDNAGGQTWLTSGAPTGFQANDEVVLSQDGDATITVAENVQPVVTRSTHASGTYTVGGAGQISGVLDKEGNGTLALTSQNAFSSVRLSQGTIRLGAAGALGTGAVTLGAAGGTLDVPGNVDLGNVIGGSGPLTKIGSGTLTLSAANTYPSTTVSAGSLNITGSLAANHSLTVGVAGSAQIRGTVGANSTTTVAGRLSGTGTVNGTVSLSSGAVLDPGVAKAGILTLSNLTFSAGSFFAPSAASSVNVTTSNGLTVSGGAGSVTINVSGNTGLGSFTLLDYAGTIGGGGFGAFVLGTLPNRVVGALVDNVANTSIDLSITGIDFPIWSGALSGEWLLGPQGGAENWVLNSNGTKTEFQLQDNVLFNDLPAVDQNIAINAADVTVDSLTFNNSTVNYTFGGSSGIAGSAALVKSGTATVTIANTNSFAGNVTINGGKISIASVANSGVNSSLGSGNAINFAGGTLEFTGVTGAFNRAINVGVGDGIILTGGTLTLSGTISGTGNIKKAGTGTVIVTGNINSNATVENGVVEIGDGAVVGANGTITNNAKLNINRTTNLTLDSIITGTGDVEISGTGIITFTGADRPSNFTGTTEVNAGSILVAGKTATAGGPTNAIGGNLLIDGGIFRYLAAGTSNQIPDNANIVLNSGSFGDVANPGPLAQQTDVVNNVTINGGIFGSLRSGTSQPFTVSGLLQVNGGSVLLQRGGGLSANTIVGAPGAVFNFDGGSTTTGVNATTLLRENPIQDSKLIVGAGGISVTDATFNFNAGPSALGATSRGSTILLNGNFTSSGITNVVRAPGSVAVLAAVERSAIELGSAIRTFDVTGTLNLGTAAAPIEVRNGRLVIATDDVVPGPGGIVKTGAGTLNLPGNQPYSGTTQIDGGILAIDGALSTSGVTINNSGTLSGRGSTVGGVVVNNGGKIVAGINGAGGLTFPTLTLGAAPTDGASLTFTSNGVPSPVTVTTTNGLVVNSGALKVALNVSGLAPAVGSHVLINYDGTLAAAAFDAFSLGSLPIRVAAATLAKDDVASSIVLNVTDVDLPVWSGLASSEWSTATLAAPKNWGIVGKPAATTDFIEQDNVLFDDTASALATTVNLSGGNISPSTVRFNNSETHTYTINGPGQIIGNAQIVKDGTGTVVLNGDHSFTNPVAINAGKLSVATIADSGTNSPLGTGASITFNGGALEFTGATGTTNRGILLTGNGAIRTDNTLTLAGLITGTGSFTKEGTGTVVLSGVNANFNGGLTIKQGTVDFAGVNSLGGASQIVTLDGGTLNYTSTAALDWGAAAQTRVIHSTSNGGRVRIEPGAAVANALALTRAGSLTGTGTITKVGGGLLRLAADNVGFSGNWIIEEGAIDAQSPTALGTGSVTVSTGGAIVAQSKAAPNTYAIQNDIALNGGTLALRSGDLASYAGRVSVTASSFVSLRSFTTVANQQSLTVSGVLSGAEPLTIQGVVNATTSALILSNPMNTFSGQFLVTAAQGLTARPLTTGNPLGTSQIFLTDARLGLLDDGAASNSDIIYGNDVFINGTAASTINVGRSNAGATNTGNSVVLNDLALTAPQLNVTGANGYSVEFDGVVDFGAAATINTTTGNFIASGNITSTGPLIKLGAGILEFTGSQIATLGGDVSVQGGNFKVNASIAETANINVVSGTLSGSGSIGGSIATTAVTGIVAPGNSAGILSVGGNATFFAGSSFNVELAHGLGVAPVAGVDYDQLNVGTGALDGAVDISGANLNINVGSGSGFLANDIFFIIVNDGVDSVTGTFANVPAAGTPFVVGGVTFEISYDADFATGNLHGGNDVALLVPEPGSAVLLLGGIAILAGRRRRENTAR